jgi:hypothetical protein
MNHVRSFLGGTTGQTKDEALGAEACHSADFPALTSSASNRRAKEKALRERLAAAEEAREKAQGEARRVRTEVEGEAELREEAAKRRYFHRLLSVPLPCLVVISGLKSLVEC